LISLIASIGLACEPGASVDGARGQADAPSPSGEADGGVFSVDDASTPSDSGAFPSDATLGSAGVGTYEVPVPAALSAAATFVMTDLVCNETMRGLLPIVSDPALIAAAASAEYAGPPQDRVDVAALFGGDPIGILRVNLAAIEAKGSSRRDR
jgi:hypothetical protein